MHPKRKMVACLLSSIKKPFLLLPFGQVPTFNIAVAIAKNSKESLFRSYTVYSVDKISRHVHHVPSCSAFSAAPVEGGDTGGEK